MTKISYLSTVTVFIFLLLSCKQQEKKALLPSLVRAEGIMYEQPDSALHLLESMEIPDPSDKLQNATWCLLMTQARDKNYLKQTSDSLINIAYGYFMKQNDPHRKAMVLNYEGVINEEAFDDIEKATQFYLEASKEVEKTEDYQLAYLINVNLGDIYIHRHISEYAMQAFQKAYKYARLSNNKSHTAYSLSYIARIYSLKEDWTNATKFYTKAYELAKTTNDKRAISGIASELSYTYNNTKDYTLAINKAQEALHIYEKENSTEKTILLTIGDIYRNIGNIDSAYYYLDKAILSDNIYTRCSAYQALWYLNRDLTKDYKKALEYSDKFWIYTDSIQTIDKSKELIKIQEMFNQEKLLNEKKQLQIEKERITRNSLLEMIVLLCIIITIIYIYQRKLIRKERSIQKDKEHIHTCTMKIHKNESIINRNENRIKELLTQVEANQGIQEILKEQQAVLTSTQQQNNALKQENIFLQKDIVQYSYSQQEKDKILDTLKRILEENQQLCDRENFLCHQLFKQTEAFGFFKKATKSLSIGQWEELSETVDEIYDNFTKRLSKQVPSLTENDLHLSCLIKLRLSIPEMAILLGISPTSVSRNKQRLKTRIINDQNSPLEENQTIDVWLWEY